MDFQRVIPRTLSQANKLYHCDRNCYVSGLCCSCNFCVLCVTFLGSNITNVCALYFVCVFGPRVCVPAPGNRVQLATLCRNRHSNKQANKQTLAKYTVSHKQRLCIQTFCRFEVNKTFVNLFFCISSYDKRQLLFFADILHFVNQTRKICRLFHVFHNLLPNHVHLC
jgi:hypothetical protein